jgi:succinate-semialdehyde dehydrogenase / glutarate-semialdehyde dehydrogenase
MGGSRSLGHEEGAAVEASFDRSWLHDPDLFREDLFVGGRWRSGGTGRRIDVTDPATGDVIGQIAEADETDVRDAIAAAQAAFPVWAGFTAQERARILRRWHDLIVENADDLAMILTAEQGKPLSEARGEILYGVGFIEWYSEEAKAGPALAAGCPMVVKPADETPLSALALAELARRAGLPDGVLNVVVGVPEMVGELLTADPRVRVLSFTGSTAVGKLLMSQSAGTVKKVALDLGGNAPLIVFDDAGQTCVCANRLLVRSGIHDAFVERLREAIESLVVGPGFADDSQQGPLISADALAKVQRHIADAVERGASVVTGGSRHALGGRFFEPTLLTGATPDMLIAREETFGPVAPVIAFDTEQEALDIANDTPFGLASYFFTRDLGRTWRVAEALEFGVVGVNTGLISYEGAPFGGVKESGLGREGSRHGMDEFTDLKYLCIDGLDA